MIERIKNKLSNLLLNSHMREVVIGMIVAFLLKVLGAGLSFVFNVAVARLLGAEGTGIYFLALSVTTIGSVIGRIGLDNALIRFVASHASRGEWGKVAAVHSLGIRMAIVSSIIVTICLFLISPWISASLLGKPELSEPLKWMSLSILPMVLFNLQAQSLKGLKRIRDAMLVQGVSLPLILLILIFPLSEIAGITGLAWSYVIASLLAALLGIFVWKKNMSKHIFSPEIFPFYKLWESCKPLLVVSFMNSALMPWAPVILLGIWVDSVEVGVFSVATRVALLLSFMLLAINNIVAPKFAELYAKKDMVSLGQTARRSALLITLMASPLFFVLFFYGDWVLSMFGKEFMDGNKVLSVLAIGQLINVICGSVGFLLMMSANEKIYRNITMISGVVQLILTLVLVPKMGGIGAAIASSIALVVLNVSAVFAVYSKLEIILFPLLWRTISVRK
jgi:O-antigen/teichoic acid export membrane protein